uniref:Putative secreted protein n=1 Tax=Ixodes ricinus TaxID=34613 RepID=A0A6B0UDI5_IXORI
MSRLPFIMILPLVQSTMASVQATSKSSVSLYGWSETCCSMDSWRAETVRRPCSSSRALSHQARGGLRSAEGRFTRSSARFTWATTGSQHEPYVMLR